MIVIPIFIANFNSYVSGLSFKIYDGILGQVAHTWQFVRVQIV